MRGSDLINTKLPDDLLFEIINRIDSSKRDSDSISLVCRKWMRIERSCRRSMKINASCASDALLANIVTKFTGVRCLFLDERLPLSHLDSSVPRLGSTPRRKRGQSSSRHNRITENSESESEADHAPLTDTGLSSLAMAYNTLEKLSLIWCSDLTHAGLTTIAKNCRFLKSLDLQGSYIGNQGIIAIGQCCKQLEHLNLRFCEGLNDLGMVDFAQLCGKSLKSLGMAACQWITDRTLNAVASHCPSLESLSLDSELFKNEGIICVTKSCSLLKILRLQCINVTDEALLSVGYFCASLELLALYSFQRFTDRSFLAIGKGCKKLQQLTLSDCYFLSDRSLEAIASGCKNLTHLEVNGCHNMGTRGLESIGKSCSALLELSLLYCQRVGNSALSEVGKNCSLLQALNLVDCSNINDEAICSIAQGCLNLKKLHIRRCYEVGDIGLIKIGENCKSLMDLSLRFVDRVGDKALIAIGQGCSLTHLNVSGCNLVSDTGITAIARGCPELIHLDISVLQGIGNDSLAEIGKGCPQLKEVVLSHCRQITDVGLSHLANGCTLLETCHMVYCPSITSSGVATIVSSCTNIKKVLIEKWKVSARTKRIAPSVLSYLCVDL